MGGVSVWMCGCVVLPRVKEDTTCERIQKDTFKRGQEHKNDEMGDASLTDKVQ